MSLLTDLNEMAFSSDKARKAYFSKKLKNVMHEWKAGRLKSGGKTKVPSARKDWAIAIAINVAKKSTDKAASHKRVYTNEKAPRRSNTKNESLFDRVAVLVG